MRFLSTFSALISLLGCIGAASAQALDRTVKIHVWPLDSPSPTQLVEVSYNPSSLTSSVVRFTKPNAPQNPTESVRIGLYDAATSDWHGVVTSFTNFNEQLQQKFTLHINDKGDVWHIGFIGQPKPKPITLKNGVTQDNASSKQVVVEIVKPAAGPTPVLNKPIVLNAEGKLAEKEPEKTFLQKYWWVIAGFFLVQLIAGGGGK